MSSIRFSETLSRGVRLRVMEQDTWHYPVVGPMILEGSFVTINVWAALVRCRQKSGNLAPSLLHRVLYIWTQHCQSSFPRGCRKAWHWSNSWEPTSDPQAYGREKGTNWEWPSFWNFQTGSLPPWHTSSNRAMPRDALRFPAPSRKVMDQLLTLFPSETSSTGCYSPHWSQRYCL